LHLHIQKYTYLNSKNNPIKKSVTNIPTLQLVAPDKPITKSNKKAVRVANGFFDL